MKQNCLQKFHSEKWIKRVVIAIALISGIPIPASRAGGVGSNLPDSIYIFGVETADGEVVGFYIGSNGDARSSGSPDLNSQVYAWDGTHFEVGAFATQLLRGTYPVHTQIITGFNVVAPLFNQDFLRNPTNYLRNSFGRHFSKIDKIDGLVKRVRERIGGRTLSDPDATVNIGSAVTGPDPQLQGMLGTGIFAMSVLPPGEIGEILDVLENLAQRYINFNGIYEIERLREAIAIARTRCGTDLANRDAIARAYSALAALSGWLRIVAGLPTTGAANAGVSITATTLETVTSAAATEVAATGAGTTGAAVGAAAFPVAVGAIVIVGAVAIGGTWFYIIKMEQKLKPFTPDCQQAWAQRYQQWLECMRRARAANGGPVPHDGVNRCGGTVHSSGPSGVIGAEGPPSSPIGNCGENQGDFGW